METHLNTSNVQTKEASDNVLLQLKDLFLICRYRWYWFVISIVFFLVAAFFYIAKRQPIYTRMAQVEIKSDKAGRSIRGASSGFGDLGLINSTSYVQNEKYMFQSPDLMQEVVRNLHLQYNYTIKGKLRTSTLYGTSLPVEVRISGMNSGKVVAMKISMNEDGSFTLSDFVLNGEKIKAIVDGNLGKKLKTPVGTLYVIPTNNFRQTNTSIYVTGVSLKSAADAYRSKFSVEPLDKETDILSLTVRDVNIERAEDLLSMLIEVYNKRWVEEKNQVKVATGEFIRERLLKLESELNGIDEVISDFKSETGAPDLAAAGQMYMSQNQANQDKLTELQTQLELGRYLHQFVAQKQDGLIPSGIGMSSAGIEQQVTAYNDLVLKRQSLSVNSSDNNRLVREIDSQLADMRSTIIKSVDNQNLALQKQISQLQLRGTDTETKIRQAPKQAKILLSTERKQTVEQTIYMYLLQKLEENELSQAFTAYNTRVVMRPYGGGAPTAPNTRNIYLIALALGILLPLAIIYINEAMITTVRTKKDVQDALTIPFAGEILQAEPISRFGGLWKKTIQKSKFLVVKHGKRDVINEAFRVLRTNVEFICPKDKCTIWANTSYNVNSGKTFLAMNLGLTFAFKKKRTLLIDCDMRKASLSEYVETPKHGLSDILSEKVSDYHELLVKHPDSEYLTVLPVGKLPPNPTELISTPKFAEMLNQMRTEYDIIFIDCPPIEILADAQIINPLVDKTLFVVRAGLMERSLLADLETLYQQKKYNGMNVVLNGTRGMDGYYGYHYGYRYSYAYRYYYRYEGKPSKARKKAGLKLFSL